jgi:hypothetical protein
MTQQESSWQRCERNRQHLPLEQTVQQRQQLFKQRRWRPEWRPRQQRACRAWASVEASLASGQFKMKTYVFLIRWLG